MVPHRVPVANANGEQQSAREDAPRLQSIEAKQIQRQIRMLLPGREQIQQLRSHDTGKDRHETHVPHRVHINSLLTCKVDSHEKPDDQA